jgi:hypothetical protein
MMRRSAKFKHRTAPRGGNRNDQLDMLQEYQDDLDDIYGDDE